MNLWQVRSRLISAFAKGFPLLLTIRWDASHRAPDSNPRHYFAQRAAPAFRAISFRRAGESFFARAMPPLDAPSFPNATPIGFFVRFFTVVWLLFFGLGMSRIFVQK